MTVLDAVVFIGLLIITEKKKRPTVFVSLLLIAAVFAMLRWL